MFVIDSIMLKGFKFLVSITVLQFFLSCAQYTFYKAEKNFRKQEYYLAIESYVRFAQKNADHKRAAEALYKAAKIQENVLHQALAANKSYKALVKKFPVGPYTLKAQQALADIQKKILKDYDEAIVEYEKLLEIAPDYKNKLQVKLYLAECYSHLGQYQQAHIEYLNILEGYKQSVSPETIYFAIANNAYVGSMFKVAIEYYIKVLETDPDKYKRGEVLFNLAASYEESDDFKKAKENYIKAKAYYPNPKAVDIRIKSLRKRRYKKNR